MERYDGYGRLHMRDWQRLVEERLGSLALEPEEKAEIIAEVAAHLEDVYDATRRGGMTEERSVEMALAQVGTWRDLRSRILATKRREHFMRNRILQLWCPGLLTLLLSTGLLIGLQESGFRPSVLGNGAATVPLYWAWLLCLPFLGAFGAYISLWAGGSRSSALLASVFSAVAFASAFLLMLPIGLAAELVTHRHSEFGDVGAGLLRDGLGWIVIPAMALLLGGLACQFLTGRGKLRQVGN